MKLARLVCTALTLCLLAGWAATSSACDNSKSKSVSAVTAAATASKSAACSPAAAAACTPEMAAACKAAKAAGAEACASTKATAATKRMKVSGALVSADGYDHCAGAKTTAVTADARGTCGFKETATAVTAANTAATSKTIVLAGANGSCGYKGAKTTATAGQCSGHGMTSMAALSSHTDCEACSDMSDCNGQLEAAGAHRQAVRLKNGIMYVYTADSPRTVSAVQAAVSRRADRMVHFASAGEKTRLCAECKAMRGAMASGKLTREVVNIEGGTLTLITSNDPTVVAKIHAMADDKVSARVKS